MYFPAPFPTSPRNGQLPSGRRRRSFGERGLHKRVTLVARRASSASFVARFLVRIREDQPPTVLDPRDSGLRSCFGHSAVRPPRSIPAHNRFRCPPDRIENHRRPRGSHGKMSIPVRTSLFIVSGTNPTSIYPGLARTPRFSAIVDTGKDTHAGAPESGLAALTVHPHERAWRPNTSRL